MAEHGRNASADHLLQILKPTTTRITRRKPGRASMGDTAEARLEPGMLDLLAAPVAGGSMPLGAGVLPETMTAFSIAATAACLALGEEEAKQRAFGWVGGEVELTWTRPARRGEPLVGRARLRDVRRRTLRADLETSSARDDEVLMTGEIRLVAVRDGSAARIEDSMLLFEQPATATQRDKLPALGSPRAGGALAVMRGALRRLCGGRRGRGRAG